MADAIALFLSSESARLAETNCADAFADRVVSITPIIAMTPSAKNSPTDLMECLAAKWRVMYSEHIKILSAVNFEAIVVRRFALSDVAYKPTDVV